MFFSECIRDSSWFESSRKAPKWPPVLILCLYVFLSVYHTRLLHMNNASWDQRTHIVVANPFPLRWCLCITVICLPSQPRRPRNTDSSMKRWWPRPRREVRSFDKVIKVPLLSSFRAFTAESEVLSGSGFFKGGQQCSLIHPAIANTWVSVSLQSLFLFFW